MQKSIFFEVLTQLDQLRRLSNVLVLTTSNLSGTIDIAFVDRADLKQYVDYPSPIAIFHIYKSAIDELIKVISSESWHNILFMVNSNNTWKSYIGSNCEWNRRWQVGIRMRGSTIGYFKQKRWIKWTIFAKTAFASTRLVCSKRFNWSHNIFGGLGRCYR